MLSPAEPLRLVQVGAGLMGRAWLRVIGQSTDVRLVGLVDLDLDTARRAAADAGFTAVAVASTLDGAAGAGRGRRGDQRDDPGGPSPRSARRALLRGLAGAVREAAGGHGERGPVDDRGRRGQRPAADGLPVPPLLAPPGGVAPPDRPARPVGLVACSFFKAPHFGGFREQMTYPLLIDMAIHQFDLARDLIGSEPVSICCESFNPGWSWYAGDAAAQVTAEFADGTRFGFIGSWCSPGLETSWNGSWRISGADGTAVWDGDHAPMAQIADGTLIPAVAGTGPEEIAGSLAEFVAALRDGSMPSGEVHSNVMSLAMVEGAIRSAQTGSGSLSPRCSTTRTPGAGHGGATRAAGGAGLLAVRARGDRHAGRAVPAGELKGEPR